ncbi:MAG: TRAP transporter large permease subunit [Acetobacteraceae bacterium]|nr:TRAP transporter large permease subunit [Acetobacteraceae bacterium]
MASAAPRSETVLHRVLIRPLLWTVDAVAALLLAADLVVVLLSVFYRFVLDAPLEWADDVARGLMVALSFLGAAGALARSENVGVAFFVDKLPPGARRVVDAAVTLIVVITAGSIALHAFQLGQQTTGQLTGSGLPLELSFYPMAVGGLCMTVFALDVLFRQRFADIALGALGLAVLAGLWYGWGELSPDTLPDSGPLMLAVFVLCLLAGMPIGFVLAFSALAFVWVDGSIPGVIFAQQMARGIDNFVLLAIPFFILIGYLMEANGMSVRLIEALERMVGRMRGGLNVVMVLSMVVFSGISGSKMADVAAVGSVLIPAARRSNQNPGNAVALLAASAVMAETIPPCINLIILGFVANISIGGLFMAGLVPAGLMALVLIAAAVAFGSRVTLAEWDARPRTPMSQLWGGIAVTVGLLVIIFGGFKSGFATATEISSFGALYALVVGGLVFRELSPGAAAHTFIQSATRSGLVLFIVAAAQAMAFVLTLQQIPHALAEVMVSLSQTSGSWLFLICSIGILIFMGSVLEGAAALIIFGPLLVPVAAQLGIPPLHYGVVLVIAMGIGLFAPPLGLGLYGACLIGGVPIEVTVKPMLRYLGLLFLCLLVIAFVPAITLWLPHALGY